MQAEKWLRAIVAIFYSGPILAIVSASFEN
jgi:hypothetical protein